MINNDGTSDPIAGKFDNIKIPTGFAVAVDYAYHGTDAVGRVGDGNDLAITLSSMPPVTGDFNGNGIVDAADYVVWRNGLGTTYTQADYDVWRTHFGQTAGSGAALPSADPLSATVPEPSAFAQLIFTAVGCCLCRRRDA